jgi:hypothetical protein
MSAASHRAAADFTRYAKLLGSTKGLNDAIVSAEATRASARVVAALHARAAVPAASLGEGTWGGEMADDAASGLASDFIEAARPASLFYRFVQRANVRPLRSRLVIMAAIEGVGEVIEGAWIPVVAADMMPLALEPKKVGAIVVASDELIRASDVASFAALRAELLRAAIAAVDASFVATISDGVTPASMNGVLSTMRTMLDTVATTGGERMIWIAGAAMANALATASDTGRLFPEMSPSGGRLLGLDAMVSDRVPADRLLLVDCAGFAANEGTVEVARSNAAALRMRTDPENPEGGMISLFSQNLTALRVLAGFGVEQTRAGAVAAADFGPV